MIIRKIQIALVLFTIIFVSCKQVNKQSEVIKQAKIKHQINRVAAEWEPALGTIVVWPLDLPHKLIIELATNDKLYTIVPNSTEIDIAKKWYVKWGIDLNNVQFIISAQGLDSWWARDWGAFAVFDSTGNLFLADGQYKYSTPVTGIGCNDSLEFLFSEKDKITGEQKIILTTDDDDTPRDIANAMGYDRVSLPFCYTGGNVFMDGRGTSMSSCILKNENNYIGVNEKQLLADAEKYLGIGTYNFISNFEHNGIQHIDCLFKLLDNNRLFVMQPPADHELFQVYENIVNNELKNLKNSNGEPYKIIRLNTARYSGERIAAYSNSLILNKNIYVPFFGIKQDSIALSQWQAAMPGYTVKGFYYNVLEEPILHPRVLERRTSGLGWKDGDALHCRTRAMWDPKMLYIHFTKQAVKVENGYSFEANIIDYSNAGLMRAELQFIWRKKGTNEWNKTILEEAANPNYYKTTLELDPNQIIEYYITVTTAKDKIQTMPITAPLGFYSVVTN